MENIKIQKIPYNCKTAERFGWCSYSGLYDKNRIKILTDNLQGKIILDIGCGGGGYTAHFNKNGYTAIGVDCSFELLQHAKQTFGLRNLVLADACFLPFKNKSADSIYSLDVLEHTDDRLALEEFIRISRNVIIFSVPRDTHPAIENTGVIFFQKKDPTHLRVYEADDIVKLLKSHRLINFKIINEIPISLSTIITRLYSIPFFLKFLFKIFDIRKIFAGYIVVVELNKK